MNRPALESLWFTAADGTRLHALSAGDSSAAVTPMLCLPGLTRNARDFEPVFEAFAHTRRIIACDLRGRGLSDRAAEPQTYRPDVEMADTLAFMDALGVKRFALLGTSRGGIIGMLMANAAPERLAGLMLNDIGPELHLPGLLRIADLVGAPVSFASWPRAAEAVAANSVGFAGLSTADWIRALKRVYAEKDGRIVHTHDLALAATFPARDVIGSGGVPHLWPLVPALATLPTALLRGAGSDLLSEDCAARMTAAVPALAYTEVPGRGHVPFLDETDSVAAIAAWLARVDEAEAKRAGADAGP